MVAIFRNSGEHFSSDEEDGDTDYESDETGEDDEEDDEDDEEEHEVVGAAPARPPQATLCPDCSNLDMTPNMRHAVIAGRPVAAVFCFLHSPPFAQNHDQCTSSQLISIQQTTMVMEATHQHDHGHYDLVDVQPHRNIPQFPVHPPPAAPAQQPVAVNALMALPRHRRQTSANAFHPYAQRPQRQQDQDQQQQQYPHYKEPQNYPQSEYWPQPQQYPPQQQYPQQQRYPAQQQPGMYTQGYDPQNSTFAMPRQIGYFPQDYFGPINTRGNRGNGPAGNRGYRRFG